MPTSSSAASGQTGAPGGSGLRKRRGLTLTVAALLGWLALIAVAHAWGERPGIALYGDVAPLVGEVDPRLGLRALPALLVAVAAVLGGPRLASRLKWRALLPVSAVAAAAWAVALAYVDGPEGLTAPISTPFEYLHDLPRIRPVSFELHL